MLWFIWGMKMVLPILKRGQRGYFLCFPQYQPLHCDIGLLTRKIMTLRNIFMTLLAKMVKFTSCPTITDCDLGQGLCTYLQVSLFFFYLIISNKVSLEKSSLYYKWSYPLVGAVKFFLLAHFEARLVLNVGGKMKSMVQLTGVYANPVRISTLSKVDNWVYRPPFWPG